MSMMRSCAPAIAAVRHAKTSTCTKHLAGKVDAGVVQHACMVVRAHETSRVVVAAAAAPPEEAQPPVWGRQSAVWYGQRWQHGSKAWQLLRRQRSMHNRPPGSSWDVAHATCQLAGRMVVAAVAAAAVCFGMWPSEATEELAILAFERSS